MSRVSFIGIVMIRCFIQWMMMGGLPGQNGAIRVD